MNVSMMKLMSMLSAAIRANFVPPRYVPVNFENIQRHSMFKTKCEDHHCMCADYARVGLCHSTDRSIKLFMTWYCPAACSW